MYCTSTWNSTTFDAKVINRYGILRSEITLIHYHNTTSTWILWCSHGTLFSKMISSYGYRNTHLKPKTVWRWSQVYNWNLYTNNTLSSQWVKAQNWPPLWLMQSQYVSLWKTHKKSQRLKQITLTHEIHIHDNHPSDNNAGMRSLGHWINVQCSFMRSIFQN